MDLGFESGLAWIAMDAEARFDHAGGFRLPRPARQGPGLVMSKQAPILGQTAVGRTLFLAGASFGSAAGTAALQRPHRAGGPAGAAEAGKATPV